MATKVTKNSLSSGVVLPALKPAENPTWNPRGVGVKYRRTFPVYLSLSTPRLSSDYSQKFRCSVLSEFCFPAQ